MERRRPWWLASSWQSHALAWMHACMHKHAQELQKPQAWQQLATVDFNVFQRLVQQLIEAHDAEAQQEGRNDKFAQHHEGRHAGMSGRWWLQEAVTQQGLRSLEVCVGRIAEALPVFGIGATSMVDVAPVHHLIDDGLAAVFRVGHGLFPMPQGKTAGDYTSMDLGRLCWTIAVLLGLTEPVPLGEKSFKVLMQMQGKNTQRIEMEDWQGYPRIFEHDWLRKHGQFSTMQSRKCFSTMSG